jgi:protein O-mannosyl-transferase
MRFLNKFSAVSLLFISLLCCLIYWPSIIGPFLFDDFHNLMPLMRNGGIVDFTSWFNFVFSGGSSALGRPLALASFTLNAQNWPTDPMPFKVTNIFIHVFNSWLLYFLLNKIFLVYNGSNEQKVNKILPLIGATIWLLHPIHLTTILQVVQRMTLLSGSFTLISLIIYTNYIEKYRFGFDKHFAKMFFLVSLIALLGILSKESTALLPLFLFSLNYTVFNKKLSYSANFGLLWQSVLLLGTLFSLFAITFILGNDFTASYKAREFDLIQRLLTESRILFDYLYKILIPKASGSGLFQDDIIISTGILSPLKTLYSILSILALLIVAVLIKNSRPFLSLAILWYFLGHALESTIWPLELYFEHRNYIPSVCLAFILFQIYIELKTKSKKLYYVITASYIIVTTIITALSTPIWGDSGKLFTSWALEKPNSLRAQHQAAATWLYEYNHPKQARQFLLRAHMINNEHIGTRMRLLIVNCYFDKAPDNIAALTQYFETSKADPIYTNALSLLVTMKEQNACKNLSLKFIKNMFSKLELNTNITNHSYYSWLLYNKSRILLLNSEFESALEAADRSMQFSYYLGTAILKIEIAYKMSNMQMARKFLKEAKLLEENRPYQEINDEMRATYQKYERLLVPKI